MSYRLLFSPGAIGRMQLPNRIIMGSMHLGYEGRSDATTRIAEFYAARARGGAALIVTGGCAINQEAIGGPNFSCIYKPEDVETLRYVTQRSHQEGGRIGLQLFHAGRYATKEWTGGLQPVAPSAIRSTLHPATPRAMTKEDIERTISDFGNAAARAEQAGFDCVEIMGSEGYLINQFFSPVTNKRDDEWGGSIENRARFAVEVLKAVKSSCTAGFPVIFRMSGIDLMAESNGWEDTYHFARMMEANGADALNIGIGWHESRIPTISMLVPRGYYSFVAARIRKHVSIPCITSNRLNDPLVAENVLQAGAADFVSLARALLSDPEFAGKALSGRSHLINTCIACNQACLDNAFRNEPTTCILNPSAGREQEAQLKPAFYRKRIAVVGAGPAGLEATRVLGERGHRVTLFEKQSKIGGQLLYAVKVPGKEEFLNTIRYYENYLKEYTVELELNCETSSADLLNFDAVILATGARPNHPSIPQTGDRTCIDYDQFFANVSSDWTGGNVAIVGAGGIGCDIAHILSQGGESLYPPPDFFDDPNHVTEYEEYMASRPRGSNVSLMCRGKRIGEKLGPTTRWALLQLLKSRGVQMHTQLQYEAITENGVAVRTRSGKPVLVSADTIIFATGQVPNTGLYEELEPKLENCYLVGAALKASETNAMGAIWEANAIARSL